MATRDSFPDITRPDADIDLISEWVVDTPQQRAAVKSAIDAVEHETWPEGLLSDNYYVELDGDIVLNYSQWKSEKTAVEFVQTDYSEWTEKIGDAPDSERHVLTPYRLYRSFIPDGSLRRPGCIVVITFETDGPEWQHKLIDWLVDRLPNNNMPQPGNISNHFHISTDGTRVFNYTEWTDANAHREVVENDLQENDEVPQMIDSMEGVRGLGYKRFNLYRSLAKP